ncbi:hypothetical protein BH18CHL2_BH18CHL2_07210 [soil metagenome]
MRAGVVILLFAAGIAAGVWVQRLSSPGTPPNPYQELPLVGEPPESREIAAVIQSDDPRRLAAVMDTELLRSLGKALQPLEDVFEVKFVGASERKGDILSAYAASGRDGSGQSFTVGLVFRVSGGKVVGVN